MKTPISVKASGVARKEKRPLWQCRLCGKWNRGAVDEVHLGRFAVLFCNCPVQQMVSILDLHEREPKR